eukprot:s3627_g8.t1
MSEEDKTASAWYKVPTWNGSPDTWRAFEREMSWWLSSLDQESTKKYNLAATKCRRGTAARIRGALLSARCLGGSFVSRAWCGSEEKSLSPKDLECQREVRTRDTEGAEIVVTPEDAFAGINKLLKALEDQWKIPFGPKGGASEPVLRASAALSWRAAGRLPQPLSGLDFGDARGGHRPSYG